MVFMLNQVCTVIEVTIVLYVCRDAVGLNPKHFRALKLLGSAMYAQGDLQAACAALQSALQLNAAYADAHCDLGCVQCALGEVEKAKLSFKDAVNHNPQHVEVSPCLRCFVFLTCAATTTESCTISEKIGRSSHSMFC